jgi:hypothetical protein
MLGLGLKLTNIKILNTIPFFKWVGDVKLTLVTIDGQMATADGNPVYVEA